MDISQYKERLKKGENIDFHISRSKLKLYFFFFLFLGIVIACFVCILCLGIKNHGLSPVLFLQSIMINIFITLVGLFCFYAALRTGKALLFKQHSKFLSCNKEFLVIYDKTAPTLLGNKNPCAIIPWNEILDLEIQKIDTAGKKHPYITFKLNFSTIQRIREQLSEKIFKTHFITNNYLLLNPKPWLDMPIEDILTLLKELYKEATTAKQ